MGSLRLLAVTCVLLLAGPGFVASAAAAGALVSGPLLGYRAHRETLIWLETSGASEVSLTYQLFGQPQTARVSTVTNPGETAARVQPIKFILTLLQMGQTYEYRIAIDGQTLDFPYPLVFRTADQWEWRKPPPDFSFLFGTCAYLNEPAYDRPGTPYGQGPEIFSLMANTGADFMIWGGDNTYLREADFSSESGIWYRYSHDRATPELQPLFAAMHHYATWDDHDYGSNDANRSFEFKETTLAAFKSYWGNATWGEADNPGVYGKFFWGDAVFILLDDRYHRDSDQLDDTQYPDKSQYGITQRTWLEQTLLHAQDLKQYPFKFIVTGGQVITSFGGVSETFANFPNERAHLLKFIADHGITGVIFLSGDVHFTELARQQLPTTQWVYELTSSPLSAGAYTTASQDRADDPQRVPGTLVADQNFCTLSLHGPKEDRLLTLTCTDKAGTVRWTHEIKAAELIPQK